jgi:hypothetical protein
MPQRHSYTVWIEAEEWAPGKWASGKWASADANTDVIVTFEDASRWAATFFSYANIQTVTERNRRAGECLAGAYFWASDMVLIDEVSRPRLEEVVQHLIQEGEFEAVFSRLPPADPPANAEAD